MRYPIAPNGIFWSIQGEAHLCGFQMGFVRLAGCSVGCPGCDTNYSVDRKLTVEQIVAEAQQTFKATRDRWVWITGGEPTDHNLLPLFGAFKDLGYRIALATSGVRPEVPPVDWLSVSPHSVDPKKFQQRYGQEVKLVDGLNGLDLEEWAQRYDGGDPAVRTDFYYKYVQPASVPAGGRWAPDPASVQRCLAFLEKRPHWSMSQQLHHLVGVA